MKTFKNTLQIVLVVALLSVGLSGCSWLSSSQYDPMLKVADEAFKSRDYALAAAQYESLVDRYPGGTRHQLIIYRRGLSLLRLHSFHNARETFVRYLESYPEGLYAEDCRLLLHNLETTDLASVTADHPMRPSGYVANPDM